VRFKEAEVSDTEVALVAERVGAVVSMVTDAASVLEALVLPAVSDTPPDARRKTTVPSLVQVTATVIEVPDAADGVNAHPVAVPPLLLKSPEAIPLTLSEKARVYVSGPRELLREDGGIQVAVGAVVSMVMDNAAEEVDVLPAASC
jgi:hypothetical protein